MATGIRLLVGAEIFLLAITSRPAVEPTQPPLSLRKICRSMKLMSDMNLQPRLSYKCTPPYVFIASLFIKHKLIILHLLLHRCRFSSKESTFLLKYGESLKAREG
jgi:hypothetical protein